MSPSATPKAKKISSKKPALRKVSRIRKPEEMTIDAWQVALRRQFGVQQKFKLKNIGDEPIFSEFEVTNPQSERTYRVAIRGSGLGENFCSCPDFAVNTLGTCKHIEFVLDRLSRRRGGKTALAAGFRPDYSQVYLQYGAERKVVFRQGTACPADFAKYAKRFFDTSGILKKDAAARFNSFLKRKASLDHEVRCYDDVMATIAELRDRDRLAESVDKAFPRGEKSAAFKRLLKVQLFPFQRQGALFAARAGRSLIADDMGLGKTIQAIAAAEILAKTVGIRRVLVISPTSLKYQWQSEIERFTNRNATVVEGLQTNRKKLYREDSFFKLTNYDVVHRDHELISDWQPDLIVLDEAQRIKNWQTRTAQCIKRLESPYAIVLTGTPLENRLEELHSIVEFVDRFRLGPMFRFLDHHQHVDENGRVVGYRQLNDISKTLKPILVRRTKDKVLDQLPGRIDKQLFVPMTREQLEHHEENRQTVVRIVAKWRRFGYLREADQLRMRIALQNMRMSCNSTYLLDQDTDHGHKADELTDLLREVLEDPKAKVVIFSQWTRMHKIVAKRLDKAGLGYVLFHGGVPSPKRKELVDRFKNDPDCRLFLSTDAGGVGLNLQNASTVVILDQPWNPAVLEQRIGRVHRMGQKKPVRIVHLIAEGTIEHGMLDLLSFKKSMFTGVLDGGKEEVFLGGSKLKQFMETVEKASDSIPQTASAEDVPSRNGSAVEEPHVVHVDAKHARPDRTDQAKSKSPNPDAAGLQDHPWTGVLQAGAAFLGELSKAVAAGDEKSHTDAAASDGGAVSDGITAGLSSLVARDDSSGEPYLRLPLPDPQTIDQLAGLLSGLFKPKQ